VDRENFTFTWSRKMFYGDIYKNWESAQRLSRHYDLLS